METDNNKSTTVNQNENEGRITTAPKNKQLLVVTRPLTGNLSRGYCLALIADGKRHDLGEKQLDDYANGVRPEPTDRRTGRGLSILEALTVGAEIVAKNQATIRAGYLVKHFGGVAAYATKQRAGYTARRSAILAEINEAKSKLAAALLLGIDKAQIATLEQAAETAKEKAKQPLAEIADGLAKIARDERALVAYVALHKHLLTDTADEENEAENIKTRKEMRNRCNGAEEEIKRRRRAWAESEKRGK